MVVALPIRVVLQDILVLAIPALQTVTEVLVNAFQGCKTAWEFGKTARVARVAHRRRHIESLHRPHRVATVALRLTDRLSLLLVIGATA